MVKRALVGFGAMCVLTLSASRTLHVAAAGSPATPALFPGVVHAEDFNNGGEGVGYHDLTPGNSGGQYRNTDVDIESSSAGGYNIGWIDSGEWLAYDVSVPAAGAYTVMLTVASPDSTGRLHARFGSTQTPSAGVPNSGSWQNWTVVGVPANLAAGSQVMKIVAETGGFNLRDITIVPPATAPPNFRVLDESLNIVVPAGGNLQAAIDSAQPGATILLQAGATYVGNFLLPVKSGTSHVTIRSSAHDSQLPGPNARMHPAYAPLLPKIVSPNSQPAIATMPGAHHYRLQFLEFPPTNPAYYDIMQLGDGSPAQDSLSSVPYELIVDRVYIHGHPTEGQKRGIALNSASTSIVNSYIVDIKSVGQDSQAIAGWNGPGPYLIQNNYLEGAGENIQFGGSDPSINGLVPSDITIRRNHFSKPLAWRSEDWSVKNSLELKSAQRVVIDGNLIENHWLGAQSGFAVVFTVRNSDGGAPWSVVQQIQFTNNVVRNVSAVFNILGTDYRFPSLETNNIVIRNNLFEDISGATFGGFGAFALINGGRNITFDHNTIFQDGLWTVFAEAVSEGFVFTNNILPDNSWAVMGTATAPGTPTINAFFPGATFLGNILVGSHPTSYPPGNPYLASMNQIGFVNLAGRNYRLAATSPYRNAATDGGAIGCNIDTINAAVGLSY